MSLHDYHEYLLVFWLGLANAIYFSVLAVVQYRRGRKCRLLAISGALGAILTLGAAWTLGWL
jgi:small-conductance mechanosensitive channel